MHVSPNGKHIAFLGDHGTLLLVDCHTRRLVDTMKMNGSSRAVAFNADGTRMYSHGTDGQVYVWDMNTRACIHTFVDDGCFHGTKLTVSSDSSLLATGYEGLRTAGCAVFARSCAVFVSGTVEFQPQRLCEYRLFFICCVRVRKFDDTSFSCI